jgi:hypothetical protein
VSSTYISVQQEKLINLRVYNLINALKLLSGQSVVYDWHSNFCNIRSEWNTYFWLLCAA